MAATRAFGLSASERRWIANMNEDELRSEVGYMLRVIDRMEAIIVRQSRELTLTIRSAQAAEESVDAH